MSDKSSSNPFEILVRLEQVAAGLEGEGFFGASKLCRALSRSILIRAAYEQGIPRANTTLNNDLSELMDQLQRFGVAPEVLTALEAGREAARNNTTTSWDEIGSVHVCRLCGEVFLHRTPEFCPTCGSHALTYWDVPHVFYLEPLTPAEVLEALTSMPESLSEAIGDMDESVLTTSPEEGEWSVRDVLWHLLMAQGVLAARAKKLLAEDNPSLEAQAVWTFAKSDSLSTRDVLAQFDQSRRELLAQLRNIPFDSWLRSGRHSEFGQVTLLEQASYFAKHERSHFPQIANIKSVVAGR